MRTTTKPARQERTRLSCDIIHETDAAVLIEVSGERHWLPSSTIHAIHRDEGAIVVDVWILEKRNLV